MARRAESKPIVDAFFTFCGEEAGRALDETPTAKAIGYALNQRVALQRFLDDGRLPIHNNGSERELRREAVGRKNWLFVGSDDAAEVNATFVSLLASCELHDLEPWAYLRDLFCLLPSWPRRRVLELAPINWQETLQNQDTQQRLDANVFRRATLGLLEDHRPQQVALGTGAVSDGIRRTVTKIIVKRGPTGRRGRGGGQGRKDQSKDSLRRP
jgi:hypothetical protein